MSSKDPLSTLAQMSDDDLLRMPIDDNWREEREFVCVECRGYARIHPHTSRIWGCKSCGFTTKDIGILFRQRAPYTVLRKR